MTDLRRKDSTPDALFQGNGDVGRWIQHYRALGLAPSPLEHGGRLLGVALICGRPSGGLVVLRPAGEDGLKAALHLLRDTARISFGGNESFCLRVPDLPEAFTSRRTPGLEVLASGSVIAAPPTQGSLWILPDGRGTLAAEDFRTLGFSELMELLERHEQVLRALRTRELLKRIWRLEREERLVEALSALCAWAHVPEDLLLLVLGTLLEETQNPRKDLLLELVGKTYEKAGKGQFLRGWRVLRRFGLEPEEVRQLLVDLGAGEQETSFWVDEGTVYTAGEEPLPVGPAVAIEALVRAEDGRTCLVRYDGERALLEDVKDLAAVRKLTGRQIPREGRYVEWLDAQLAWARSNRPVLRLRKRTGWEGDSFLHPALQPEDPWDHLLVRKGLAGVRNPERQHEAVLEALREGWTLGGITVLAASAPFVRKLGGLPFCVFIVGPPKRGKTTLGLWGCSLFYRSDQVLFSANTTFVGAELAMKDFQDLPILFDNLRPREIDVERIVFMVSSQAGRTRGTKHLVVSTQDLSCVVFFTSETFQPELLQDAGAQRRILVVEVEDWPESVSGMVPRGVVLRLLRTCSGAGLDWIRWAAENPGRLLEIAGRLGERTADDDPLAAVKISIYGGLEVLEAYYGERFDRTRTWLEELFRLQTEKFEERTDEWTRFKENFGHFLAQNAERVLDRSENPASKRSFPKGIMALREGKDLYIRTDEFERFCAEYGHSRASLLRMLEELGVLIRGQGNHPRTYRWFPHPVAATVCTYHLVLPEEIEKDETPF